jgi:hypothetical protein
LIIPNVYGVPVAFLGVPNTEPLAAAGVLLAVAPELPELAELLEPLELQPAATSPMTATVAGRSHLGGFICASFGEGCYLSVMVEGKRPPQAAVSPR